MEVEAKSSELTEKKVVEETREGGGGGKMRSGELALRVVALLLTLAAAVTLGVDKQTKKVSLQLISTLPPLDVSVTAKWRYSSAFTYFVVANGIACSYAAVSAVVSASAGMKGTGRRLGVMAMDMVMVSLLFSSHGAAGAIGVVGYQGNSHLRWGKVCDVFGKFCHQVAVALGLSFFGGLAFFGLVIMAAAAAAAPNIFPKKI